jgi:hypothetical protein
MTKCCQVVFQVVVPWESCTRSHAIDIIANNQINQKLVELSASQPYSLLRTRCIDPFFLLKG